MYEDQKDPFEDLTREEQMEAAYESAFSDFYGGQALEDLRETLHEDLYHVIRLAFLAGFRAAGGRLPSDPESRFM